LSYSVASTTLTYIGWGLLKSITHSWQPLFNEKRSNLQKPHSKLEVLQLELIAEAYSYVHN